MVCKNRSVKLTATPVCRVCPDSANCQRNSCKRSESRLDACNAICCFLHAIIKGWLILCTTLHQHVRPPLSWMGVTTESGHVHATPSSRLQDIPPHLALPGGNHARRQERQFPTTLRRTKCKSRRIATAASRAIASGNFRCPETTCKDAGCM